MSLISAGSISLDSTFKYLFHKWRIFQLRKMFIAPLPIDKNNILNILIVKSSLRH